MKINLRKSFIFGVKGLKLSRKEYLFIKKHKPWGIILFQRNIKNIDQAKKLTSSIKKIFNDPNYPILIDEEGGRVSRLKKIVDNSIFSGKYFGNLYKKNKKKFNLYYKVYVDQISYVLNLIGVNINTVPVLDLRRNFSHKIIGNRSYSFNKNVINEIGDITINLFHYNRIGTIIKHIPGHGLSTVDSHEKLPSVEKKRKFLIKNDFDVFKSVNPFFAMTSHVIYKSIDPKNTATHSSYLINNIVRKDIGFKGILITDDISMKALKFSLIENAIKALEAGCNLALHCNGKLSEMIKLAKYIPQVDDFTQKKTSQFYKFLG